MAPSPVARAAAMRDLTAMASMPALRHSAARSENAPLGLLACPAAAWRALSRTLARSLARKPSATSPGRRISACPNSSTMRDFMRPLGSVEPRNYRRSMTRILRQMIHRTVTKQRARDGAMPVLSSSGAAAPAVRAPTAWPRPRPAARALAASPAPLPAAWAQAARS